MLEPLSVGYIVDFFTMHKKEVIYSLLSKAINFSGYALYSTGHKM